MPSKERIIEQLKRLPTKPIGRIAEQEEIWEEDESGAHFIVSREQFPHPVQMIVFSLSVSGDRRDKRKIIQDFRGVLGQEMERGTLHMLSPIEFLLWDASSLRGKN